MKTAGFVCSKTLSNWLFFVIQSISTFAGRGLKINKDEQQNLKYSAASKLSYGEMHDKLCNNAIELSKQLLPLISKKRIEIKK